MSRHRRIGHNRAQSINLPILEQDAFLRLSFLANDQLEHLPVNPNVKISLEDLHQSTSAFVRSSKYVSHDVVEDQRKHKRNKSYAFGSSNWKQRSRLPENSSDSFPHSLLSPHSVKELDDEKVSDIEGKPPPNDSPPPHIEPRLPSPINSEHPLLTANPEDSSHSPTNGSPIPLRGSLSPLFIRQLSSSSENGCLSYLSTPESPYVKEGGNVEDSFKHSMFVVDDGEVHVDPRASLSELKSENALARP